MELRRIYNDGMSAYALAQKAKKSINTVNKYWEYIITEKEGRFRSFDRYIEYK